MHGWRVCVAKANDHARICSSWCMVRLSACMVWKVNPNLQQLIACILNLVCWGLKDERNTPSMWCKCTCSGRNACEPDVACSADNPQNPAVRFGKICPCHPPFSEEIFLRLFHVNNGFCWCMSKHPASPNHVTDLARSTSSFSCARLRYDPDRCLSFFDTSVFLLEE